MFDAARGKRPMPTADELRAWAVKLGTPSTGEPAADPVGTRGAGPWLPIEEVSEALEPFARLLLQASRADRSTVDCQVSLTDIRRAADVLARLQRAGSTRPTKPSTSPTP